MSKPVVRDAFVGAIRKSRRVLAAALCATWILNPDAVAFGSPTRVDQLVRNALQLQASAARGERVYREQCARCHGAAAQGDPSSLVPALARQRQAYVIKQLADFAESEREVDDMHEVVSKASLNEPRVWADLSAHLRELPAARPETGESDSEAVELGEAIYHEQCASCHEEDARGDDDGFVPSIRDQHYSYLVRQMRGMASSHRLNVDADLVRFLDSFEADEIAAVADYLSRERGPTRDRSRLNDDGTLRD